MVMNSLVFARACHLQKEGSQHQSRRKYSMLHPGVAAGTSLPPGESLQGIFMSSRCGEQLTRTAFKTGVK